MDLPWKMIENRDLTRKYGIYMDLLIENGDWTMKNMMENRDLTRFKHETYGTYGI